MRFNFKKVSALATSTLLLGMTAGVAAAANYPAPFVDSSGANVAVVFGTGAGVSYLDQIEATNILSNLQSHAGGTTTSSGDSATITGDAVSLDTSNTRIYLNRSLTSAKSTLTESDLPVVLGDSTFSGNVEAKLTSNLEIGAGTTTAATSNNGVVIFAKQPKSSNDPTIGISLGDSTYPLYNATFTSKAINFTHTDSEGETITLFGRDFVVSTATDTTDLVLFSSAQETSLSIGGSSPSSTTLTVDGQEYTVELITGSDTTAKIAVNGESKELTEGASSKKLGGIDVALKSVTESSAINAIDATILVGADTLTFTNGQTVTVGSDSDPVDGTKAYLVGGTGALTKLAVEVYRPTSSEDAIAAGEEFVDPVFGSFKVDFVGLSSSLDDTGRETISVQNSGDETMSLTFTDDGGNTGTFDFAHNESGQYRLGDDSNYTIFVQEMANLTENTFTVIGNEYYGHILEVTQIYNNTGTDYTNDKVKFQDVISGTSYEATFTSEGTGTINIDGKQYTVTFGGSGDSGYARLKYPTSDSQATTGFVFYPTVETQNGALVSLYEPLTLTLGDMDGSGSDAGKLYFPDGDGYTSSTFAYLGGNATNATWTIGGTAFETGTVYAADTSTIQNVTVGRLTYSFTKVGTTANSTKLYLTDPEAGATFIKYPSVTIFEEKDDASNYEAIVISTELPAGTSDDGTGVDDVLFSSTTHWEPTMQSDSDITQHVDWWGTLVNVDASDSDQKFATVSYPKTQVYAQIYVAEEGAAISASTGTGSGSVPFNGVIVADSEVSTVSSKNLVIVGGSCINSAAASLLGGGYCGADFTDTTGVKSGEFLIKGYTAEETSLTTKFALLVAGYNEQDTVNAATYLRTQTVDTSKEYKGTSATSASLVVETA